MKHYWIIKTSPAIRTRTLTSIENELAQNGVPVFSVRLHEREAFRSIFSFGGTLSELNPKSVRNIPAAVDNAQAFAAEVIQTLKTQGRSRGSCMMSDRAVFRSTTFASPASHRHCVSS